MKKIVATRMYDFDYFHDLFFKHYGKMGFDILIFCNERDIQNFNEKYLYPNVYFYELPKHKTPYEYEDEKKICNWIYQQTLTFYESKYLSKEAIILFADDDEYYINMNPTTSISKVVFFEWYLPINQEVITATEFLNLIKLKLCRGQLLSLWNDPYYKEAIIRVSSQNIQFFRNCIYSNAFHRLLNNNKLSMIEKSIIFSNHLKGIPLPLSQERISKVNKAITKHDDWCSNHYFFEYKKFHSNYSEFYNKLKSYEDLVRYSRNRIKEFRKEESYFEVKVLPVDWNGRVENTPSLFFNI